MKMIIDNILGNGCINVRKINENGEIERYPLYPGEWDELNEFAPNLKSNYPDEWTKVQKAWTPEAIAAWKQNQAELKNEIA